MTTDKRILRTQNALHAALEELAVNHDYGDITVTKLTKLAGINRKTFYLHYNSIDDLVDTYADQVAVQLAKIIRRQTFKMVYHHPGILIDELVDFLRVHSAAVQRILFSDDYSRFAKRIERALTKTLAETIRESYPMTSQDAAITPYFLVHNTLSLYGYFTNVAADSNHFDREQFKRYVSRLNLTGLSSFFKE